MNCENGRGDEAPGVAAAWPVSRHMLAMTDKHDLMAPPCLMVGGSGRTVTLITLPHDPRYKPEVGRVAPNTSELIWKVFL
jgi:hypothetical protein